MKNSDRVKNFSRMWKVLTPLTLSLLLCFTPVASAASLNITIAVWSEDAKVSFAWDQVIPSQSSIQKQILQNCKKKISDIRLGSRVRAEAVPYKTAGLGKVTGVSIGKVYKGYMPGHTSQEYADPPNWLNRFTQYFETYGGQIDPPNSVSTVFIAPCIFKGSMGNLRTYPFYRFYIGDLITDEYDIDELQSMKWKLSLTSSQVICENYYLWDELEGCSTY